MQVINKARTSVQKLWSKQKKKDTSYRWMHYLLKKEIENEYYLYNIVTSELISLNQKEKESLKDFSDSSLMEQLIEKHFLVPVDFDEKKVVDQIRRVLMMMNKEKDILGYTILPTTHCNARCFYCYEIDFEHVQMTEETAHKVVEYIAENSHGKKVSIGWFGGEPLVGVQSISQISKELKEKKIEFQSNMISNGALFTEELIQEAKENWHLNNVQITIDGTEKIYNVVKAYIGLKGSPYQIVLNNIRNLSKAGISVSIRINLGFHNVDDTKQLIEELSETFKEDKNVTMYCHELFEGEGKDKKKRTQEENDYLLNKVNEFNECASKKGKYIHKNQLPSLITSYCMADKDSAVIIQPDGRLTKCEHCSMEESFGSIFTDEKDQNEIQSWKVHETKEECKDCPLYPSCFVPNKCNEYGKCVELGQRAWKINEAEDNFEKYIINKKKA